MSTEPEPKIISVERVDESSVIVEFSDNTFAEFTAAQLLASAGSRHVPRESTTVTQPDDAA